MLPNIQTLQNIDIWTLSEDQLNSAIDLLDNEMSEVDYTSGYFHKLQDLQDEIFQALEARAA